MKYLVFIVIFIQLALSFKLKGKSYLDYEILRILEGLIGAKTSSLDACSYTIPKGEFDRNIFISYIHDLLSITNSWVNKKKGQSKPKITSLIPSELTAAIRDRNIHLFDTWKQTIAQLLSCYYNIVIPGEHVTRFDKSMGGIPGQDLKSVLHLDNIIKLATGKLERYVMRNEIEKDTLNIFKNIDFLKNFFLPKPGDIFEDEEEREQKNKAKMLSTYHETIYTPLRKRLIALKKNDNNFKNLLDKALPDFTSYKELTDKNEKLFAEEYEIQKQSSDYLNEVNEKVKKGLLGGEKFVREQMDINLRHDLEWELDDEYIKPNPVVKNALREVGELSRYVLNNIFVKEG
jgi:hypothetical protein